MNKISAVARIFLAYRFLPILWPGSTQRNECLGKGTGGVYWNALNVPNGAKGQRPRKLCNVTLSFSLKCLKISQIHV